MNALNYFLRRWKTMETFMHKISINLNKFTPYTNRIPMNIRTSKSILNIAIIEYRYNF